MTRHRRFKRLSAAVTRFLHGMADATLVMLFFALIGLALGYTLAFVTDWLAQLVEKLG